MAFSNTVKDKFYWTGRLVETGTWTSDGGTTTGTITADSNGATIVEVHECCFASNGDTAVKPAKDVGPNKVKITFTANDSGHYTIIGRAA